MGRLTKEEVMECLTKKVRLMDEERELQRKSNYMLCGVEVLDQIHIDEDAMREIIETLQPVVTYNPTWYECDPSYLEAYFFIQLFGRPFKVFALYDKKGVTG